MKPNNLDTAVFGGGCFWCTEAIFARLKGVVLVTPGYAGGKVSNPTYLQVNSGNTEHAEVVRIEFNPQIISYKDLLDIFWHIHNPTTLNRQGPDVGTQYRSAIFYTSEAQKHHAEESLKKLEESKEYPAPITTKIEPLDEFYTAEQYHMKYFENNPFQPYCQLVIEPKLQKFLEKYRSKLK